MGNFEIRNLNNLYKASPEFILSLSVGFGHRHLREDPPVHDGQSAAAGVCSGTESCVDGVDSIY